MIYNILKISLYLITFAISLYALKHVRFEKMIPIQRMREIWVLYVSLSIIMSYLLTQWLLDLLTIRF